jgi:pyridoxamine 5'-phosphate oxidase
LQKYKRSDMNPADIRKSYALHALDEKEVMETPFLQFKQWWDEVLKSAIEEPNAMTLATSDKDGLVEARTVLLKGFDESGFVFFTNYESVKGQQLSANPNCCLLFFWKELERQVRIIGKAEKVTFEETHEYFQSRPEGSRIGAWASPQSTVVSGKSWLEENYEQFEKKFEGNPIETPAHWGGYRVVVDRVEFWQGRPNRMHDRIQYRKDANGLWIIERLAP